MAETRVLNRSVPHTQVNYVSNDPLIGKIAQALQALGTGDNAQALRIIDGALSL